MRQEPFPIWKTRTSPWVHLLHSCTIKLIQPTEDSSEALRIEASNDKNITDKIVDLAELSKTSSDGTFYIQCLQKHKPMVSHWLSTFLITYATAYPNQDVPLYPSLTNSPQDHILAAATQTLNWSKHQSFLDDKTPHHSILDTTMRKSIPESIIIGQNMSYIAAASRSNYQRASDPTNCCWFAPALVS